MNEAEFWSHRIKPLLQRSAPRTPGCLLHAERVENSVASGTPDVDYCVAGVAGKIELKYQPKPPKRVTSQVLGKDHGLRRSQVVWTVRRRRAHGLVFAMIGTPDRTWLIDLRPLAVQHLYGLAVASSVDLDSMCCWSDQSEVNVFSYLAPAHLRKFV